MATLYLSEQGSKVSRSGQRLIVKRDDELLLDIPLRKLSRIFIFGNVQLTTQAITALFEEEIDVAYFSARGRYKGSLGGVMSKNIPLRVAQYRSWFDEDFKIGMGRNLIVAKLTNMQQVAQRYRYNHPEADFAESIKSIKKGISNLATASSTESIMGIEGYCSREYFKCFAVMCRTSLEFTGRNKHPSTDPINALLSLGYTLVTTEIGAILEAMSIDPYLGYLHGVRYGRKSLALDMVEEFRQAIVDPFTLRLINLRMYTEEDFQKTENGMRLYGPAFKNYIAEYEKKMDEANVSWQGENCSWRKLILYQIEELEQSILENREYRPHNQKRLEVE